MDLGDFGGFITALLLPMRPLRQIAGINAVIQRGLAAGESVFGLLDETEEVPDAPDAAAIQAPRGAVQFDAVSFRYKDYRATGDARYHGRGPRDSGHLPHRRQTSGRGS